MISVFINDQFAPLLDIAALERTAQAVLVHQMSSPADLTVAIEDDQVLHQLNKEFLGLDAATDVLSFPGQEVDPENGHLYLGDIVISFERAAEQASKAGHPVVNEIQLLIIHGILHLLGFDHAIEIEKKEMWDLQTGILRKLGIQINAVPED